MTSSAVSTGPSRRYYVTFGVLLLAWATVLVLVAARFVPDGYWYSYFSVDYSQGFIRRGLAGEIVNLFPDERYFGALAVLRWIPTVLFALGLAAVAWFVAVRSGRSDRRWLLALLIPVLPFGFAFGVFSARTDLLGAAALALFAVALAVVTTRRAVIVISALYGAVTVVLTLIHEATVFLFGLGAIVALVVLAGSLGSGALRLCAALALGPGIVTALVVSLFGARGRSAALCEVVPHGAMNHPLAGNPTPGQLLRGFRYEVDYHDWMCRAILPLFDQSFGDALGFVASIGVVALVGSTIYGVVVLAVSMGLIAEVSGVSVARFRAAVSGQRVAIAVGLVLILPVFLTGVDWIRWWVIIAYDLAIVFLLFASRRAEIDQPPTPRSVKVLTVLALVLALVPIGIIPGFGAPVPM